MNKLMEKFNGACMNLYVSLTEKTKNERGATTIEWVGLAFVILTLMAVVATAVKNGNDQSIATSIIKQISGIIDQVGGGQ